MAVALPQPPEPLTPHEQSLVLVKAQPPTPQWAFYLVALLTALGGWVMGWIYIVKDGAKNKLFGLRAMLLGFVLPLVVVAVILLLQLLQRGASAPLPQQPGTLLP